METIKGIKVGDLFYTQFYKMYYFLQIVYVNEDIPPPIPKYGYFIVVFKKAYNELPKSIEELDLINIYKINPDVDKYEELLEFSINYFGNTKVLRKFCPSYKIENFAMAVNLIEANDGIKVLNKEMLHHTFLILGYDKRHKKIKSKKSINPKYFPEWLEYIDADKIIKIEKIIDNFENNKETVKKSLKKCIKSINKLDENDPFICTIEREGIYEKLMNISMEKGISEEDAEKIIEDNRDW
jgi:hypothetical protein